MYSRLLSLSTLLTILIYTSLVSAQTSPPIQKVTDKTPRPEEKINGSHSLSINRVGAWPYGPSLAVAVDEQRDLIFLGSGGVVLVLDGQDRTNPQLISESIHTAGLVEDLCYDFTTQRLYIATGEGGMEIWDVQNPDVPVQLTNFEVLYFGYETPVEHIGVYGNYAVVACSWGYVHSIDVSDPTNPVQVSLNGTMGNPARDLFVSPDGQAHTSGAQYYVRFAIQPDGTLNSSASKYFDYGPYAVYGNEAYAYVGYSGYLFILPLPNAYTPLSVTDMNGIGDIVVKSNLAYIINSSGLQIWDIANPNSPSFVGQTSEPDYGEKLVVAEGYAYIARYDEGLSIVEIGDGTSPVEVGSYNVLNITFDAFISGNYAYLAHVDDGMLVIDLGDNTNPTLVGQYDTPDLTYDVYVSGNYAYVADLMGGLRIADITNPTNPTEVGVLDSINVFKVTVSGSYAYVVNYLDPNDPYWVSVVDVSNPANPLLKGSIQMPGSVSELDVTGNYVFVAADDDGIRVIDVSNPDAPAEVAVFTAPNVYDIDIQYNYAYFVAADWQGGFGILNISDPTNPFLESLYNPTGWFHPFDVTVEGTYAWLGDPAGVETIYLFDITDPANPIELDSFDPPGGLYNIFAVDSLVYISDGAAGLQILENLLYSIPGGNVSWQNQNSGTTNILSSVFFVDQNNGWTVGEGGMILRTADGGQNWQSQTSGTSANLNAVYFTDVFNGWAVGDGGIILNTTDGGNNWLSQLSGTSEFLTSVCFINSTTGWVVGDYGTVLKTGNGGSNWQPQNSGATYGLASVDFVDANNGWCVVADIGMVLKTIDGGSNWQTIVTGSQNLLTSLDFVNVNVGWAVGTFGEIQKTTDGGNNWQNQTGVFPPDWLYSVCFIDENNGWTVGFDGKVQNTKDGGANWSPQTSGIPYQLNSVCFVDQMHGWAVGENGIIISTISSTTGIDENIVPPQNQPDEFILYNNYPNPFNPNTTISFNMPSANNAILEIYNLLGQKVRELANGFFSAGKHEVIWDGTNSVGTKVSSGIYFYALQSGDVKIIKKMLLSK